MTPVPLHQRGAIRGVAWCPDDTPLIGYWGQGLRRIPLAGGEATEVTTTGGEERDHRWPRLLPGGQHVPYAASLRDGQLDPRVLSLGSGEVTAIPVRGSAPTYVPAGYLVSAISGDLWAVRFDLATLLRANSDVTGDGQRFVMVDEVTMNERAWIAAPGRQQHGGSFAAPPGAPAPLPLARSGGRDGWNGNGPQ